MDIAYNVKRDLYVQKQKPIFWKSLLMGVFVDICMYMSMLICSTTGAFAKERDDRRIQKCLWHVYTYIYIHTCMYMYVNTCMCIRV